jgi:hypothetical protein
MWLKNDGAPPHFSKKVRGFFNENYEGKVEWKKWTVGLAC